MTDFATFLAAKRGVDDRSINPEVWDRFARTMRERTRDTQDSVRIVDVGAGVGTMAVRLAQDLELSGEITYSGIEREADLVAWGRERLPGWLEDVGYDVATEGERVIAYPKDDRTTQTSWRVSLAVGDAFCHDGAADVVIAAAFLDIVDTEPALDRLAELLRPHGLLYVPLTFNGETRFTPPIEDDDRIERAYHRHMNLVRSTPGGSRAGRNVLRHARKMDLKLLASGNADWIIRPGEHGYRAGEATVLAHLLDTIADALEEDPDPRLTGAARETWIARRREQLARGELGVRIHHIDALFRNEPG